MSEEEKQQASEGEKPEAGSEKEKEEEKQETEAPAPAKGAEKAEKKEPEKPPAAEKKKKKSRARAGPAKKEKAEPETQTDEPAGATKAIEQIIELVGELKVKYMPDLRKALEEKFEVTAASAAPVAVAALGAAPAEAEKEEKTTFDVVLTEVGERKIQVIKAVRSITDLGLRDAKGVVDSAPRPVKEGVTKDEAEQVKAALEEAGAAAEIR